MHPIEINLQISSFVGVLRVDSEIISLFEPPQHLISIRVSHLQDPVAIFPFDWLLASSVEFVNLFVHAIEFPVLRVSLQELIGSLILILHPF